jgi:DNA-binding response OmpR family regulator
MLLFSDRHRVPLDAAQFSSSGEPGKAPRSLRIIVADDDRDMVLSLMMLLREEGHDVRGFHFGRHVMPAVIDLDPDVVVLDINLPEVSGWQLASTIRARRTKTQTQPLLIGISGVFTKGPDKILAELNGFDHYLVKPYAPEDLLALLAPLRDPNRGQ